MAALARSNADIVAEYLDCVLRKDHTSVDRFFHPEVEYMVNGSSFADGGFHHEYRLQKIAA
jgi:ketosteroid isomerase-like protein